MRGGSKNEGEDVRARFGGESKDNDDDKEEEGLKY